MLRGVFQWTVTSIAVVLSTALVWLATTFAFPYSVALGVVLVTTAAALYATAIVFVVREIRGYER